LNFGKATSANSDDSLRYWKREKHVDGFRFDLASGLAATRMDLSTGETLHLREIAADPELGQLHLIEEPWAPAVSTRSGFPA